MTIAEAIVGKSDSSLWTGDVPTMPFAVARDLFLDPGSEQE